LETVDEPETQSSNLLHYAAARQFRCHQLPPLHRDHPSLPPNHGIRIRALQNSRHLHRAKDSARRPRTRIHLPDIRTILRRWHRLELDGEQLGRFAGNPTLEACCQVLFEVERQRQVSSEFSMPFSIIKKLTCVCVERAKPCENAFLKRSGTARSISY
jgi:hypothetical protein